MTCLQLTQSTKVLIEALKKYYIKKIRTKDPVDGGISYKEKKLNERLKDELVQSSKNLNQLIARIEEKIILGEGLDMSLKKGRLLPPVQGRLLNKFGRKRDNLYNTYIVYNGINILSPIGASVRAVFEGKTLYTGTLEGYGNIIILGHGKGSC